MRTDHPISMHLQGMWVAFGVAAAFIVLLPPARDARARRARRRARRGARRGRAPREARVARDARGRRRARARDAARRRSRSSRRSSSAQLGAARAASAARRRRAPIREQVERCRAILEQMAADAGESAGEALASGRGRRAARAPRSTSSRARARATIAIDADADDGDRARAARARSRRRCAASLKNAHDASPPDGAQVAVAARRDAGALADRGRAIAAAAWRPTCWRAPASRSSRPRTAAGARHGARAVPRARRARAARRRLVLDSRPDAGTTVTLVPAGRRCDAAACGPTRRDRRDRVPTPRDDRRRATPSLDPDRRRRRGVPRRASRARSAIAATTCATAGDYDEALALARDDSPELAVVDLRMPGPSGLELVRDAAGARRRDAHRRAHRLRQHRDRDRGGAPRRHVLPAEARRRRRHPRRVRARRGAAARAAADATTPRRRWRAPSGSTSTACSPTAAATSRRPRAASAPPPLAAAQAPEVPAAQLAPFVPPTR